MLSRIWSEETSRDRIIKLTIGVSVAVLIVCMTVSLASVLPKSKADVQVTTTDARKAVAQDDRPAARATGADCSAQGWPNYEQGCLFDRRRSADHVPTVRIVK